jgi:hypothetical protein
MAAKCEEHARNSAMAGCSVGVIILSLKDERRK